MNKFVLIGGMPRSGTNLTRRIIGSHSDIAIPTAEFAFFRDYSSGKNVRQILTREKLARWDVEFSDLYERSPSQVYVTVLQRYAAKAGKKIYGEKTPLNEFYLGLVEDWLSDHELKCVILMRNPLDVVASYKFIPSGHGKKEKDVELVPRSARNWRRSITLGLAKQYARPQSYYLLKYEDLVADPHKKAKELCDFIGVEFEESRMLSLADYAEHKDNTSFEPPENLQQSHRVYQPESRKRHLTEDETAVVREACGELAWAVGYEDENFAPIDRTMSDDGAAANVQFKKIRRWSKSLFSN